MSRRQPLRKLPPRMSSGLHRCIVFDELGRRGEAYVIDERLIASHCHWLNDKERAVIAKPLPIDERRVVIYIFGYTALCRYFVPDGTVSN